MSSIISRPLALISSLLLAAAMGCADTNEIDGSPEGTDVAENDSAPLAQFGGNSGARTVQPQNGMYIADVNAIGSGCPSGSWNADVSSDGQVFTLTFSKYEVKVEPNAAQTRIDKDCTVAVNFRTQAGLQLAITDFAYAGYANLTPGATARLTASYNWSGLPNVEIFDQPKTLNGPGDASFLFTDKVLTPNWSPCGSNRQLNVNTKVSAMTLARTAGAYINLSSIDAQTKTPLSFKFKLFGRRC